MALIIANQAYTLSENRLDESLKTKAKKLSDSLKDINYCTRHDSNVKNIMDWIKGEVRSVGKAELILFYFAGHCCQIKDKNYLIPIDDTEINVGNVEDNERSVSRIIDRLREKTSGIVVVILDCYRPYSLRKASSTSRK